MVFKEYQVNGFWHNLYLEVQNFINKHYAALKKKNPVTCLNLDKPGGHHDKWNKPDTERYTSHDHRCGILNTLIETARVADRGR